MFSSLTEIKVISFNEIRELTSFFLKCFFLFAVDIVLIFKNRHWSIVGIETTLFIIFFFIITERCFLLGTKLKSKSNNVEHELTLPADNKNVIAKIQYFEYRNIS